MISKLKYLTSHYDRDIKPAAGATIGSIYYTSKVNPLTNKRTQYVINIDTKTIVYQTIDGVGNPLLSPGASVISTTPAPLTDINLYITNNLGLINDNFPKITTLDAIVPVTFGAQTVDNLLTHVLRNGNAVTMSNVDFQTSTTVPAYFTFNAFAGTMTVLNNAPVGVYTFNYTVTDKIEAITVPFTVTYNVV